MNSNNKNFGGVNCNIVEKVIKKTELIEKLQVKGRRDRDVTIGSKLIYTL
jgi:hypothetical protein